MWAPSLRVVVASAGLIPMAVACTPDTAPVSDAPDPEDQAAGDDADPDFEDPDVEVADGTEEPADDATEQVALQLPGLPIGGTSTVASDTLQCAAVNWSGPPDIPDGVRVQVTEITLEPAGIFALSSETCADAGPSCLPILWASADEPCTVPITWTGEAFTGEGRLLVTAGQVVCGSVAAEVCTDFRDEVAAQPPRGIPLEPPPQDAGDGGPADSADSPETSDDPGDPTDDAAQTEDPSDGTTDETDG